MQWEQAESAFEKPPSHRPRPPQVTARQNAAAEDEKEIDREKQRRVVDEASGKPCEYNVHAIVVKHDGERQNAANPIENVPMVGLMTFALSFTRSHLLAS